MKNRSYGKPEGGPVSLEVPWRSGTAVRSASREDLIRLLVPAQTIPAVELLGASATAQVKGAILTTISSEGLPSSTRILWYIELDLYVTPRTPERVVFPVHKTKLRFRQAERRQHVPSSLSFRLPQESLRSPQGDRVDYSVPDSHTIRTTAGEAVISGPGRLFLAGHLLERVAELPTDGPLEISLSLTPATNDRSIEIKTSLTLQDSADAEKHAWSLAANPESE